MARPKKNQEQKTLKVGIEDFVRTRDSVVTGLATLQSAVQDLSRAYIAHTNTVIGKGAGPSLELLNFTTPLGGESGLFNTGQLATPAPAPAPEQGEGKKKRKRAPHDKNAPKRPVTPYFLYMSFARDGIAKSMGSGTSAKQLWQEKYGANYAAYKEKVKAYKAGLPIPEFTPDEIQQMYDEQRGGEGAVLPLQEAPSDNDEKSDSEGDEESDATSSQDPSPEPPKAVSPPKSPRISKRGKVVKGKAEKKATPVKATSPNLQHSLKSPDTDNKKNKTAKKRGARALGNVSESKKELQEEVGNSPAKSKKESEPKQKRKKRKSEAADA